MNAYQKLQKKQQKEVNNFPMVYAFGQQQFEEAMQKLGLAPSETDKVCSVYGCGDILLKKDLPAFLEMLKRHHQEMTDAICLDVTGEGFIYEMFSTELANHEYSVTCDISDTLNALNLTMEQINNNRQLLRGLIKAMREQDDWYSTQTKGA